MIPCDALTLITRETYTHIFLQFMIIQLLKPCPPQAPFRFLHDFGALRANRGFITSPGTPGKQLIDELSDTCRLLAFILVVKYEGRCPHVSKVGGCVK